METEKSNGPKKEPNFMIRRVEKPLNPIKILKLLNFKQWLTFFTSFAGWTLDAFDFFLVTFAIEDISKEFNKPISQITGAITITLMMRPVGALIFGILSDKFGRKIPLIVDILIYSTMGVLTGFSNNYAVFMTFRAIFGIAMGGEWGLGAALAMECLPLEARGLFSGILQQGYATGYLFAAVFFYVIYPYFGWRAMFWFASIPSAICIVMRCFIPESESWKENNKALERQAPHSNWFKEVFIKSLSANLSRFIYCIVLMSCFNFMSHGSQDLFPTFLRTQMHYDAKQTTITTVIANIGALLGGITVGYMSEYMGRKRTMILSCFISGCFIPLWILSTGKAGLSAGVFFVQFFIQGAWGSIPAYLSELSPALIRGTFPGLVYQLGNLVASSTSQIEAALGEKFTLSNNVPNYGLIQGVFVAVVLVVTILVVSVGPEEKGKCFVKNDQELETEKPTTTLDKQDP